MKKIVIISFLTLMGCQHETRIDENRVRIDFDDGSYCIINEDAGRVCYDRFGNITSIVP